MTWAGLQAKVDRLVAQWRADGGGASRSPSGEGTPADAGCCSSPVKASRPAPFYATPPRVTARGGRKTSRRVSPPAARAS